MAADANVFIYVSQLSGDNEHIYSVSSSATIQQVKEAIELETVVPAQLQALYLESTGDTPLDNGATVAGLGVTTEARIKLIVCAEVTIKFRMAVSDDPAAASLSVTFPASSIAHAIKKACVMKSGEHGLANLKPVEDEVDPNLDPDELEQARAGAEEIRRDLQDMARREPWCLGGVFIVAVGGGAIDWAPIFDSQLNGHAGNAKGLPKIRVWVYGNSPFDPANAGTAYAENNAWLLDYVEIVGVVAENEMQELHDAYWMYSGL